MAKFFSEDNPFNAALTKIFDLCVLNVCALIFCIPIVTAGASMTALYAVMLPMSENKEGPIVKSFIKQFRANLKGSVKTWLVMLFVALLLMFDLYVWTKMESSYRSVFFGLTIAMLTALAVVASWYFGLRATFEDTGKMSLINAGKYALIYLPASVLMGAYTAGLVYVYLQQGYIAMFIPIFGVTLIEYPKAWYMRQKFNAYIADHSDIYGVVQEEDLDESSEEGTGEEGTDEEETRVAGNTGIGMDAECEVANRADQKAETRNEEPENGETGNEKTENEDTKKEDTEKEDIEKEERIEKKITDETEIVNKQTAGGEKKQTSNKGKKNGKKKNRKKKHNRKKHK